MKQLSKFVFVKNNDPTFHREADSEIGTDISLAPAMKIASNAAVSQNVTFSQNNAFDPRRIQVVSFGNPRAFIYKSFLSTAECDFLIGYAKPSMHKSGVVDADSGNSLYSEIRTSTGSFIPSGESWTSSSVLISPLDPCFRHDAQNILFQE